MNDTSRISNSRSVHGLRPSTLSSPSYGVSPRIALSAVVLPAPLGPMSPRMRPASTRKSMPSTATVVPNAFRKPRASMHAMASALLLGRLRFGGLRLWVIHRRPMGCAVHQFFRLQAEPLDGRADPRPFFAKKLLSFACEQNTACAGIDEHAQPSSA